MPLPQYNPADASNCWPDGEYDAELVKVEDRVTSDKSKDPGQPMQYWKFTCYRDDGKTIGVDEFVTMKALFKVRDLAKALGKADAFKAGKFQADDHQGASLRVVLKTEQSDGYDDKNKIARYLPPRQGATAMAPTGGHTPKYAGIQNARPERTAPRGAPEPPYGSAQELDDSEIPF